MDEDEGKERGKDQQMLKEREREGGHGARWTRMSGRENRRREGLCGKVEEEEGKGREKDQRTW